MVRGEVFFFFQAEDGIRDIGVTGVQTCALPISLLPGPRRPNGCRFAFCLPWWSPRGGAPGGRTEIVDLRLLLVCPALVACQTRREIGRASCRERVEISVVAVSLKKKQRPTSTTP